MKTEVWIQALVLAVVSLVQAGFCKERELSLQKYEKTESSWLVCPTCPQATRVRKRKKLEWCASRCKKDKKFKCRAFNFEKLSRTCHLLPFDRLSPGAQTQNNVNFTLYERKDYIRECIVGTNGQYRGRRSWTKSNITCQAWSDNSIHDHTYFPDQSPALDLRENFCRSPKNQGRPWCYTTDPNTRVEECGIPQCSEEVCMTCNGEDYQGRVDQTESGRECQRWDSQRPHRHPFQGRTYRDKDLKDSYCRNPDHRLRPWCYTMDPKTPWEYCNISVCDSPGDPSVNVTTSCVQGKAADYRGTVSMTPRGLTCQRWDSQFPHNHSYLPQNYKCRDLRENYCRNPDGSDYPWCFTTDPHQRRASCTQIPRCDALASQKTECYRDNGEAYQGTLSMTRSGIPCGDWSHHINRDPHSVESHVLLEKNYCRNPDRDKNGPWCYTSSSSRLAWDYCDNMHVPVLPLVDLTAPSTSCIVHINTRIVGGHQVHGSDGSWVVSIQRENNHLCGGTLVREDWVLTDQQCFTSCVPDLKDYSVQVGLRHLNASSAHPRLHILRLVCGPEGSGSVANPLPPCPPSLQKDNGGPLVCQDHQRKVIIGVSVQRTKCASSQPALFVNVAFYSDWIYKVFKHYPS
uniref:Hepatocyte growth factor a n=1 Tax=Gadus morhua TaxID=8049 RepID=A0A8C5FPW7_GADMO